MAEQYTHMLSHAWTNGRGTTIKENERESGGGRQAELKAGRVVGVGEREGTWYFKNVLEGSHEWMCTEQLGIFL